MAFLDMEPPKPLNDIGLFSQHGRQNGQPTTQQFRADAFKWIQKVDQTDIAEHAIRDAIASIFNGDVNRAVSEIHAGVFQLSEPSTEGIDILVEKLSDKSAVVGDALTNIMHPT